MTHVFHVYSINKKYDVSSISYIAEFVQLPIIQLTTSDFCDLRIEPRVLSCRVVNHWPILPHTISLLITWKNKIRIPCNDNICAVTLHAE